MKLSGINCVWVGGDVEYEREIKRGWGWINRVCEVAWQPVFRFIRAPVFYTSSRILGGQYKDQRNQRIFILTTVFIPVLFLLWTRHWITDYAIHPPTFSEDEFLPEGNIILTYLLALCNLPYNLKVFYNTRTYWDILLADIP